MSISVETLFEQKTRQFSAQAQHDGFMRDFLKAVNNATKEYAIKLDLASYPDAVTSMEGTLDVDEDHAFVLDYGIDMWLIRFGHRSGEMSLAEAGKGWDAALATARQERDQTDAAAATDRKVFGMIAEDE